MCKMSKIIKKEDLIMNEGRPQSPIFKYGVEGGTG